MYQEKSVHYVYLCVHMCNTFYICGWVFLILNWWSPLDRHFGKGGQQCWLLWNKGAEGRRVQLALFLNKHWMNYSISVKFPSIKGKGDWFSAYWKFPLKLHFEIFEPFPNVSVFYVFCINFFEFSWTLTINALYFTNKLFLKELKWSLSWFFAL